MLFGSMRMLIERKAVEEVLILVPKKDASKEAKRQAHEERSRKFGIEKRQDADLSPPAGYPADLGDYGDPVNFKYPIDTEANARTAFNAFTRECSAYRDGTSKRAVYERITQRLPISIDRSFMIDDGER